MRESLPPFRLLYPSDLRLPIFPSKCLKMGLVARCRWGIGEALLGYLA